MGAVEPARGEQFLGTDHPQLGAELGPDQVLAPFAAAQREIGGLRAETLGEVGEELRVFVIRMRPDDEDALGCAELLEEVRQRRDAAGARGGEALSPSEADGADTKEEGDPERAAHYGER